MKEKDMYLPAWVCGLGIFMLAAAAALLVCTFAFSVYCVIGTVICLPVGIFVLLCWKNQWARMETSDIFTYSTMFGNQKQYRFSDIRELKQNSDSMTLILQNGKIHIESCVVLSDRFADAINHALGNRSETA